LPQITLSIEQKKQICDLSQSHTFTLQCRVAKEVVANTLHVTYTQTNEPYLRVHEHNSNPFLCSAQKLTYKSKVQCTILNQQNLSVQKDLYLMCICK